MTKRERALAYAFSQQVNDFKTLDHRLNPKRSKELIFSKLVKHLFKAKNLLKEETNRS